MKLENYKLLERQERGSAGKLHKYMELKKYLLPKRLHTGKQIIFRLLMVTCTNADCVEYM